MTARELRLKYLQFFESKGHSIYPSGSLVPYDVTGRLDESLLFNGAGMVQFKPYFRGVAQPPNKRLTTAQKCVRTGDIESVGNLSHLTFFEMLGNFSFGDYFKKTAIDYSWEFLTSTAWLGLDPNRLSFTVFGEDDEAFEQWCFHLKSVGIDPTTRVFRLGEETNYWPAGAFSSGPPGPCGPNSEMFYWTSNDVPPPTGDYSVEDWLRDDEAKNWLEIWNDVFIQSEWQGHLRNPERPGDGYVKDGMPDLPFKSIDTGMGLERTIAVLNGLSSVYETDLFEPIIRRIKAMMVNATGDENEGRAIRIIADHIRTACFCIADGVLPGNTGRGYVLRRLIRRAVLKGQRTLGFDQPFFHLVFEGVVEAMGDHYTELVERREMIAETLLNEESLFRRTVANGTEMLAEELEKLIRIPNATRVLDGHLAFRLYDTFGFPLEVTRELCEEAGVQVNEAGYEQALLEAQERSRGASGMDTVYGGVEIIIQFETSPTPTQFDGYQTTDEHATIVGVVPANEDGSEIAVALDRSPFYAESGGQVGDTGVILGEEFELEVLDVGKQDGVWIHLCRTTRGSSDVFGKPVRATVDANRRARIIRNHTATHLLHAALREVLGKHVAQKGSLVEPRHLRFDFSHGKAMTPEEISEVEQIVNTQILSGKPVNIHADVPIAEAKALGAMALFGEKYGDRVRVVEIPEFSIELCGGIHVNNTGQIGLFRITSESSAASGVRRIEAISGLGVYEQAVQQSHAIREAAQLLKSTPGQLVAAVARMSDELREERQKLEKLQAKMVSGGAQGSAGQVQSVGPFEVWTAAFEDVDQKIAANGVDQAVNSNPKIVALAAVVNGGKVTFICKIGSEALANGAHAGNIVREVSKVAGGGGGGRPDFATAGGKDPSKVSDALSILPSLLG
ncbi:MAG: alanine--tRNA ligase [Fimbriimonadaceae bacterium]